MRSNLVLLGGVAAVVAGVFSFCVNALFSLLLMSNEVIPWPVSPLLTLAGIVTTLLYAFGLAGLYSLLGRRSRPGIAGLVLVSGAFLMTLTPWAFGIAYALYQELFVPGDTIASSLLVFPQFAVEITEVTLLAVAVLLLGLAALRTRVLGPWTFVPLVIGLLSLVPLLSWAAHGLGFEALGEIPFPSSLVRAPFWALLGVVMCLRADAVQARGRSVRPA